MPDLAKATSPKLLIPILMLLATLTLACADREWWTGLENTPEYQNCHDYVTSHLHPSKSHLANWPCLKLADKQSLGPTERQAILINLIQNEAGTKDDYGQFNRRLIDNDLPSQ